MMGVLADPGATFITVHGYELPATELSIVIGSLWFCVRTVCATGQPPYDQSTVVYSSLRQECNGSKVLYLKV
jgi:hypothetical protein